MPRMTNESYWLLKLAVNLEDGIRIIDPTKDWHSDLIPQIKEIKKMIRSVGSKVESLQKTVNKMATEQYQQDLQKSSQKP